MKEPDLGIRGLGGDVCMDGRTDRWMEGWTDGQMDGQIDGQMDGWKFTSVSCRTSALWAAAQKV